ncbi:MAG: hypothetical protein DWC07_03555 [Candidatus Poseidoniales archaeon]|nr:MAG: hypothetical protein DWC07_03555 [Candidatus Poseidoniales archaeon]
MSAQVEMTNPVDTSVGGMKGHILRRAIHLGMVLIPFVYFEFGENAADLFNATLDQLVAGFVLLLVAVEGLRLRLGITVFGQRAYESKQISALAWGGLAICMVLLLTPEEAYAWPLIVSLALGDPFMGELRRKGVSDRNVMVYATGLILAIWLASTYVHGTPLLISILLPVVCMASEWPRLTYIDDNATMILIPLTLVLLLEPFFGVMA